MLPDFKLKSLPEKSEDYIEKHRPFFNDEQLGLEKITHIKRLILNLMLRSKKTLKDEEFVSILFRLCIFCQEDSLNKLEFFSNLPINFCLQNIPILNESKRYHSVAIVYYLVDQYESAFEIWKKYIKFDSFWL
jgi:hypothetical protein